VERICQNILLNLVVEWTISSKRWWCINLK